MFYKKSLRALEESSLSIGRVKHELVKGSDFGKDVYFGLSVNFYQNVDFWLKCRF